MKRTSVLWRAGAAIGLLAVMTWREATPVSGQAAASKTTIEKEAISALEKMGVYLRSLRAFQVEAATTSEEVLADGQKVQFTGTVNALVRMPDRLRLTNDSDRRERTFIYDGKQFTMFARRVNFYATVPAPGTIKQLADVLDEKYGVEMPLQDLFRWGSAESPTSGITAAMFIGPSKVGGVTCGHYAFRQEGLDWQVWIQLGDYPLPRKLVLTTTTDAARPQYTATLDWNLAPSFNEESFVFVAPKGAGRVALSGGQAGEQP